MFLCGPQLTRPLSEDTITEMREIQEDLKQRLFRFLLPIRTEHHVDRRAFEEVIARANDAARLLKSHELVSKALLNDLHMASKVLRAEAAHIKPETEAMLKMAGRLEFVFDLILLGESPEDRVSGVARIV
jgi:hypothetical protein